MASLVAIDIAMYSASALDAATAFTLNDAHETGVPQDSNTYPAVAGCYFATCGEPGAPASQLCRLLSSTLLEVLALGESGVPASQLVGASGAPRRVRHASEVVAGGVASPPWRIRYAGGPVCGRVACVFYFVFFNSFGWRAVGFPLKSPRGGENAAVYGGKNS